MSDSAQTLLHVDGVEAIYGDAILALRGVSFGVPKGTIVALLGANGAGKSTTLKAVSNLLGASRGRVSKGAISWRGEATGRLSPADLVRRGIVQVLEGRHCFPQLTVEENLLSGGFARRPGRRELKADLERMYALFPRLKLRRRVKAGLLSGGEQQMVAIGRALMSRPTLMLLDEPSMGLAPMIVEEIFEIIRRLNSEEGVTFLLAEQNAHLVLRYADHGWRMGGSRRRRRRPTSWRATMSATSTSAAARRPPSIEPSCRDRIAMTQIELAWGAGPSTRYDAIATRFRPLFHNFRDGAAQRDRDRKLPFEEFAQLKQAGFGALRVPMDQGGAGASLPELFALLIELSEAESNLTQSLRAHFGFTEDVLHSTDPARRDRWLGRIGRGDIVGGAWSEVGDAKLAAFSTWVSGSGSDLRLDGTKYYTTGSLFADWIDVGATDAADEGIGVVVSRHALGVQVLDDWDGIGQTLTASGTAIFTRVGVEVSDITKADTRFGYAPAFFQLVQLATIAGIGRALASELAQAVARRARTYTHAAGARSSEDPQVLQVVGRVRGAAYAAGAIVLKVADALQRAADARADPDAFATAVTIAELESAQAQTVVIDLVLQAATIAFDALGASAVKRDAGLDRHWRNARTLASHNPRIYKDRIVGDYAVNGTPPPSQWRVGRS